MCSIAALPMFSQVELKATVYTARENSAMQDVLVQQVNGEAWALTNEKGEFRIELPSENTELVFSFIGFATKKLSVQTLLAMKKPVVHMEPNDLSIDEVVVIAVPVEEKVGSAVKFDAQAIEQVQSFSIADVLEQLPGKVITPPSLNSPNSLTIRTAQPNLNNAFGLQVVLDDAPISNDENMQTYNYGNLSNYDNVNSSVDLRQIPTSNIEEIEVVTGIPDAKYGNLTSGLVKVKTKAGKSKYQLRSQINGGATSFSINKGFRLNDKLGAISVSADYLNANQDPRNSLSNFDRINTSLRWTFNRGDRFRNNFSFSYGGNFDELKVDPDTDDGQQLSVYKKDRSYRLSNSIYYQLDKKWIDNLNASASFSYAKQHSYRQSFFNFGGQVVPLSTESGLSQGTYTAPAYLQKKETFGEPISLFGDVSMAKSFEGERITNNFSAGIQARISDNAGRGKQYEGENAHTQITLSATNGGNSLDSQEGMRPLNYRDYVYSQKSIGAYVQNNFIYPFANENELIIKLGARYDNQLGFSSFSPRLNVGYELSDAISVRGGVGFASKAPSLSNVFPGNKYFDFLLRDFRTNHYSWNLIQTYQYNIDKVEIDASKTWKYEVGANLNRDKINASLTGFYNYNYDGFSNETELLYFPFPIVEYNFVDLYTTPPTYKVKGYDSQAVTTSFTKNSATSNDYGVEMIVSTPKIKSINTSFAASGSYTDSNSSNSAPSIVKNTNVVEERFTYKIYEPSTTRSSFIKSNVNVVHHISELALLLSFTAEQMWSNISHPTSSNPYPIGYITANGKRFSLTPEQAKEPEYKTLVRSNTITKSITPFYSNYHFRLSKEFNNGLSTSLYATNFLNYRPIIQRKIIVNGERRDDSPKEQNQQISFGAHLKFSF